MGWIEDEEYLLSINSKVTKEPLSTLQCCILYLDHEKNIIESKIDRVPLDNEGILTKDTINNVINECHDNFSLIGMCSFHISLDHDGVDFFLKDKMSSERYFHEYLRIEPISFPPSLRIFHSSSYFLLIFKSNNIPKQSTIISHEMRPILKLKANNDTSENTNGKRKKTVRFLTKNKDIEKPFRRTMKYHNLSI